jgi:hypothetical protein
MALLPTNVAGGQTGHLSHSNQAYKKLNNAWVDAVADFAAVGDGAADDTTAVQNALNATPQYGTCLMGRHKITATLSLPRAMRLLGTEHDSGLYASGSNFWFFDPTGYDYLEAENLTFDGNYPTRTSGTGFALSGFTNVTFRNCAFKNIPEHGITLTNCQHVRIKDCVFDNLKTAGVYVLDPGAGNTSSDIWIEDNFFNNCQAGRTAGNAAIQTFGTAVGTITRLHILRNRIKIPGLDGVGIGLDYAEHSDIVGNKVEGAIPHSPDGNGENIVATGRFNKVLDNEVWNAGGSSGIMTFCLTGKRDGEGTMIRGNHCWDCNGAGIVVTSWSDNLALKDFDISHNRCWNTGVRTGGDAQDLGFQEYWGAGVTTGVTWAGSRLAHNDFRGNTNPSGYLLASPSSGLLRVANILTGTTMDFATASMT